jgi:beta-1,4-mannosyltransferase
VGEIVPDPLEHRESRPTALGGRVAFFPSAEDLGANPYWPRLRDALAELGAEVVASTPMTFGRRWLWSYRGDVRILHIHFVQPFYAYEAEHARLRWVVRFARNLALARAFGYRTVFSLHDLLPSHPLRPGWVDYLGHWVAATFTDRVIVHCTAAQAALRSRFGRRTGVHVVPLPSFVGIYANDIPRDDARARLGLARHHRVFLFFGGLRPYKNLGALVEAFAALSVGEARLLIVGSPDLPPGDLERLRAQCARDGRVRLEPRYVRDDEVGVFLNAADAVVLPFSEVLTSSSAVLAMSFARAVVAPARGCLTELLSPDAGVLYEPREPDALGAALRHCLTADLAAIGQAAFERVRNRTWQAAAQQTLAAYQSAAMSIQPA